MTTLQWILIIYLSTINLFAFTLMGIDKERARKGAWRIPEKHLFLSVILGGSVGGILGMRFFRHKIKHWYFKYGFPLIFLLQVGLGLFLYGR